MMRVRGDLMGFWMGVSGLVTLMMMADDWGGPHWLVGLGQGICTLAIPMGAIAFIYSVCHEARTTPTHSEPSHDDQQKKNK